MRRTILQQASGIPLMVVIMVSGTATSFAQGRPVRRGIVGLVVRQPTGSQPSGAEIARLEIGSPAYRADLRPGDVITHLNGEPVLSAEQFAAKLHRPRAGTRWDLAVRREGQVRQFGLVADPVAQEKSTASVEVEYKWVKTKDGTPLRAVLTLPSKPRGRLPAILILPGLGGVACDEPDYSMYRELAWEFTNQGFMVFRWDQRGAGDSYGGDYAEIDFDTEVADAQVVVAALFADRRVERSRIYAFAYSMGGVVAPHVIAKQDGLAGLITYGTISRPFVEYMIDVAREQSRLAGLGAPEANRQVRLIIRFYERLLSGEDPVEIVRQYPQLRQFLSGGRYAQGKTAEFWRQLDSTLYARLYGNASVPTLALYAENDFNATTLDQTNIVALATAAGRADVHFVTVPHTDHYMNTATSRAESFRKLKAREYKFNPVVAEATTKWIYKLEEFRRRQSSNVP